MNQHRCEPARKVTARRIIATVAVLAMSIITLGLWGCTTTIIPPSAEYVADDPVHVHIADYGRHSSIMLPLDDDDERMVEYGFGEWRFFALDDEGVGGVARALLVSSDGTLSRRYVDGPFTAENLQRILLFDHLHTFRVHRDDAIGLRHKLDQRYDEHLDTEIYNQRSRLYFVKVDEPYSLANNCNPVLARWLEQLGCELRGPALLSSWRVRQPE